MKTLALIAFACFVFAGDFKDLPLFGSLPVDLTLLLALVTLLFVIREVLWTGTIAVEAVWTAALFYLVAFLGALRAPSTEYAVQKVQRLFTLSALAVIGPVVLCRSRRELTLLVWALCGVALVIAVSGVVDPQAVATYAGAPRIGLASTTIELGRAAGLVLVVAVVALVARRLRWWVAAPLALLGALALLNSGSRGPLAAAIGALALCLLLSPRRTSLLSVAVAAVVTAGVLWIGLAQAPEYARVRIVSFSAADSSVAARLDAFDRAARIGSEDVWGVGWGGFALAAGIPRGYPHDIVLEFWAEAGLLPALVFVGWTAVTWWRSRGAALDFVGMAAFALLTFTLLNALVSGDVNDNRLFWVAMGMATVSGALAPARDEREAERVVADLR